MVSASFSAIGFVLLAIACGFGFQRSEDDAGADDEEADDGGSVSIGWFVHYLLSFKARGVAPGRERRRSPCSAR